MKYDFYADVRASDNFEFFDFVSTGKTGTFSKRVIFQQTTAKNIFNLAFGDTFEDGTINDYSISNNGDRNKILATVAHIVDRYTSVYPERMIFFRGSTAERTRLYRMALSINLNELSEKYVIYGLINHEFVKFEPTTQAEAFLIQRKIV